MYLVHFLCSTLSWACRISLAGTPRGHTGKSYQVIHDPEVLNGLDALSILEALHDEVAVLDASGRIVAVNAAWRNFSAENDGDARQNYLGTNYLEVCRSADGASSAEARLIPDGLQKVLHTGQPFRCEYPCHSPTTKRWFEMTANRFRHDDADFLIVQHRNITRRKAEREDVEEAFVRSNAMTALLATTRDAVLSYDLDGRILTWNSAAERLYGYSADEAIGQSLELLYPPDWPKRIDEYRDEIIAGRLDHFEAPRVAKDGTVHDVWIAAAPIRSPAGEVIAVSNIHRDVTETRRAERARDLIANEVIHRTKNLLGIVSAIQRQTARRETTLEGFQAAFEARIQSLSNSTNLLVSSGWSTVSLRQLIGQHLEPFVDLSDRRLDISGPDIDLRPQCVQTIGMAVHELATNSVKHGALNASSGGRVAIRWALEQDDDRSELCLSWAETGVTVSLPDSAAAGFGSTVLTNLAPSMLEAKTQYDLSADRVNWTIRVPDQHFSLPG